MAKDITLEIEAVNIGPHRSLKARDQISSLELGIFANNGSGKTFISRMFRLIHNKNIKTEETNKLLTLGENQGRFLITISNVNDPRISKQVKIDLRKNSLPSITNSTDYTFHVFNREYVKENLEEVKYRPNGKIEGYILGKEKIDLTKEKEELDRLQNEATKKIDKVTKAVGEAISELNNLSIRKNTSEYVAITAENILASQDRFQEPEPFDSLRMKHSKLKSIPEDLSDIKNIPIVTEPIYLEEIPQFLLTSFNKSSIAEDFKAKLKRKQSFIETGLDHLKHDESTCPFCEQKINAEAARLIDKYTEYFNDAEAEQIAKANKFIQELERFYDNLVHTQLDHLKLRDTFSHNKGYFPSMENEELSIARDPQDIRTHFDAMIGLLEIKKNDVGTSISNEQSIPPIAEIRKWIQDANGSSGQDSKRIAALNSKKTNIQSERLELNKRLCKAKYVELVTTEKNLIAEINDLRLKIREAQEQIREKEQTEKVSKKTKVVETFRAFLESFFSRKYSFDDTDFCLRFHDHSLKENTSDVLSDGEKSIVAFCYFLAETHTLIEKEDDYKNLFFVIDDPISSLDFHFVYSVAQAIRTLNDIFRLARIRYLVLTHNLEFMSILIRNKIVKNRYFLHNGKLQELKRNLIMPYEEHLVEVVST